MKKHLTWKKGSLVIDRLRKPYYVDVSNQSVLDNVFSFSSKWWKGEINRCCSGGILTSSLTKNVFVFIQPYFGRTILGAYTIQSTRYLHMFLGQGKLIYCFCFWLHVKFANIEKSLASIEHKIYSGHKAFVLPLPPPPQTLYDMILTKNLDFFDK